VHQRVAQLLEQFDRLRPMVVKPANGFIRHPCCIPDGFYQQQWDWDDFFIATHLAGRTPPQPEYLKYWALNFLYGAKTWRMGRKIQATAMLLTQVNQPMFQQTD
jgi:hypothetical protein